MHFYHSIYLHTHRYIGAYIKGNVSQTPHAECCDPLPKEHTLPVLRDYFRKKGKEQVETSTKSQTRV